jgi:hypothetical protein
MGVTVAWCFWTKPEEEEQLWVEAKGKKEFEPTQAFEATDKKPTTQPATPLPEPMKFKRRLPCIQECDQLTDRELLLGIVEAECGIQEGNSRDCMNVLWCLACRD